MSRWHSKVKAPQMNAGENPTRLEEKFFPGVAGIPSVMVNRMLSCPSYERCLTLAVSRDWPNFTCKACSSFRAEVEDEGPSPIPLRRGAERMDIAAAARVG